jgi:hypothetical protein
MEQACPGYSIGQKEVVLKVRVTTGKLACDKRLCFPLGRAAGDIMALPGKCKPLVSGL